MHNTTRTTTITNTDVELENYTPVSNTNSAGTKTTSFVITDHGATVTHTM